MLTPTSTLDLARAVLARCRAAGAVIRRDGDRIRVVAPGRASPDLLAEVRALAPEILILLREQERCPACGVERLGRGALGVCHGCTWRAAMLREHGLVPHRRPGHVCPRRATRHPRRSCTYWVRRRPWSSDRAPCLCEVGGRMLDHPALWRDARGCVVYTGEPYGVDPADLARFRVAAEVEGLEVTTSDRSPWARSTTLIIVAGRP